MVTTVYERESDNEASSLKDTCLLEGSLIPTVGGDEEGPQMSLDFVGVLQ